ncbi:MAG: hypothetical protein KAU21_11520, partial [Gammaproteobacteria bacterium]|nr:hypothetical protein [Gammaproteobacteria bacterium]
AMGNDGKWYAIFGNGYNDSGSGEAQLFILDIEHGINNGWALDTNYWKISTGAGSTDDRYGLATPALADVDGNGTVDRVYAGDLQGNMWVFDFSANSPGSWGSAYLNGQDPTPLFTTPANQAITVKPVLARHPTIPISSSPDNSPNLMVLFGTGQYLVDGDKSSTNAQAFYGVWDNGTSARLAAHLIEQTFITNQGFTNRVLTSNQLDYETDYGWWITLPDSGERVVTSAIARHTEVFFNTFVPTTDPCSVGGYGYKFAVDMNTGGSPSEAVIDTNEDGEINESDNDGAGVIAAIQQDGYLPEPVFIEDLVFTGSVASKIKKLPFVPSGRFSWQELIKQ